MQYHIQQNNGTISSFDSVTQIRQSDINNINAKQNWTSIISGTSPIQFQDSVIDIYGDTHVLSTTYSDNSYADVFNIHNIFNIIDKTVEVANQGTVFLTKYTSTGRIISIHVVMRYSDTVTLYIGTYSNNIIISGNTTGSAQVNGGPSISPDSSFILLLDRCFQLKWFSLIQSTSRPGINDMAIQETGDIYVSGSYTGNIMFSDDIKLQNGTGINSFVVKYNQSGIPVWATQIGNLSSGDSPITVLRTIALGSDFLVTAGYSDAININTYSAPNGTILTPHEINNNERAGIYFSVKYDLDGQVIKIDKIASPVTNSDIAVAITASDDIYIAYETRDMDTILAKYNRNIERIWATILVNCINSVICVHDHDVIIAGNYSDNVILNDVGDRMIQLTSIMNSNMCLAKYNTDGALVWAAKQLNVNQSRINVIGLNRTGIFIYGDYTDTLYNYNSTGTLSSRESASNNTNVFTTKYTEYAQNLFLTKPVNTLYNKIIVMESNSGYPSLVSIKDLVFYTGNGIRIHYIFFHTNGSFVSFCNMGKYWKLVSDFDVSFIYINNGLINY